MEMMANATPHANGIGGYGMKKQHTKDDVINALKCLSYGESGECFFCPCPYGFYGYLDCKPGKVCSDAAALLEDSEIIRCSKCQFYNAGENDVDAWERCMLHKINTSFDNFCSWAVKKEA